MKKSLLCFTALASLLSASVESAELASLLGSISPKATATIYCSASRFFPGSSDINTVGQEKLGGLEANFLVTNTSETKTLKITKVDVYGMRDSVPLITLTPLSTITTPAGDPEFKWTLAPHETTRLPHEATLDPNHKSKPDYSWFNVVFTVASSDGSKIMVPMVYTDYVEKATPSGAILANIRSDCVKR